MEQKKIVEDEEERCWSNLQIDILCIIKSHLFGSDRIRFHAVCKAWSSVPSQIAWLSSWESENIPTEIIQFPSLMFLGRNTSVCNFFNPLANTTYSKVIPDLANAKIWFSKDGWLLMTQGDVSIMFFNPFTNEKIHLPDLPMKEHKCNMICFSSHPTSHNCLVLAIRIKSVNFIKFSWIRRGESTWTRFQDIYDEKFLIPCYSNPVFYNGALHCLSHHGKLHIFDPGKVNTEDLWIVLDEVKIPPNRGRIKRCYLTVCDEELVAVFEGHVGKTVDVFKLDRAAMGWKRVKELGNRMLFVSLNGSVSVSAREKFHSGMQNKVYFPRFKGEDGIFYSLFTGKFHSFSNGYSAEDFYGTKEQVHCVWIQPNLEKQRVEELTWS
ncbi:hypothetical protein SLEP1_g20549 [Rubroshorea leprosula]|uniref:KIB1-4 beta-propeller domain-containing protein n=1 Tax=Rubroshorea leprosula TaxID=152421 RepID=A0AAV5J8X7_9ROSI|nr:hypothetical protein SLEP1_g20549 [Rubroshorea leprosula]